MKCNFTLHQVRNKTTKKNLKIIIRGRRRNLDGTSNSELVIRFTKLPASILRRCTNVCLLFIESLLPEPAGFFGETNYFSPIHCCMSRQGFSTLYDNSKLSYSFYLSVWRIPDPDFYPSRIPDHGSRISDPGSRNQKQQWKTLVKKNLSSYLFFGVLNFTKLNYFIFKMLKKKIWANFKKIIEFFTQKIVSKLSKIWVWDPGSAIRKKPIPDPGSRGQKGTGSRRRNTDTCYDVQVFCKQWKNRNNLNQCSKKLAFK